MAVLHKFPSVANVVRRSWERAKVAQAGSGMWGESTFPWKESERGTEMFSTRRTDLKFTTAIKFIDAMGSRG
jgi:hypothetical protein